jgi:hypothetical protein
MFPGAFFPENVDERVKDASIPKTVPSDCYGFYFSETEYAIGLDGKEFVGQTKRLGKTVMIGELIHVDDIPDIDSQGRDNDILKSNIKYNSPTKQGIKTHLGNWQLKDRDVVVMSASEFKFGKPVVYKNLKK